MSVASEHVGHPGPGQVEHPRSRDLVSQRGGRDLNERAEIDEVGETVGEIRRQVTLGMSDECAKATSPQLQHRGLDPVIKRSRSRLQQDPTRRPPQRHRVEVVIVKLTQRRGRNLAARQDSRLAAGRTHCGRQFGHAIGELPDRERMIVADVRRRAYRGDADGLCLPGHLDSVVHVASAVIESGQQMAVEIDRHTSGEHGNGA